MAKLKKIKYHLYITPVTVVFLIICMAGSLLFRTSSYSISQNPDQTSYSLLSWQNLASGDTAAHINTWYRENSAYTSFLSHINYALRKASGDLEIDDIFLGKGRLLEQSARADQKVYGENIKAMNKIADNSEFGISFLLIPQASNVLTDSLPAFAPVNPSKPVYTQIHDRLNDSIDTVNLYASFQEDQNPDYYFRTDPHLTSAGAGQAYLLLQSAMGKEINLDNFEEDTVKKNFQGILAQETGSIYLYDDLTLAKVKGSLEYTVSYGEDQESDSIYNLNVLNTSDPYRAFLISDTGIIHIETSVSNNKHLLLIKDDYADPMVQYLLQSYSQITIIDPQTIDEELMTVLNTYQISDIMVILGYDSFVTSSALSSFLSGFDLTKIHYQIEDEQTSDEREQSDDSQEEEDENTQEETDEEDSTQ